MQSSYENAEAVRPADASAADVRSRIIRRKVETVQPVRAASGPSPRIVTTVIAKACRQQGVWNLSSSRERQSSQAPGVPGLIGLNRVWLAVGHDQRSAPAHVFNRKLADETFQTF